MMISIEQAIQRVRAAVEALPTENVDLDRALQRFLARNIVARWDLPTSTHAAMDGFAVRAADVAGSSTATPTTLAVVGRCVAGAGDDSPCVGPGQAVRITTGARVPPGADAVIRVEDTRTHERKVEFHVAVAVGHNVRHRGSDVVKGAPVLRAGTRIDAHAIGALAAFGHSQVEVHHRPLVAIASCGDELVPVQEARPDAVVDSNAHVLAAMARECGADVELLGIVGDDPLRMEEQLRRGVDRPHVLVTSAGASVGERDHTREVLEALGTRFIFSKVALKPGKPVSFGRCGNTWVFALPGNPGAAAMTFELLVRPALRALQGAAIPLRPEAIALLPHPVTKRSGLTHCVWTTARAGSGGLEIDELNAPSSGSPLSALGHNAIAALPRSADALAAGHAVPLWLTGPVAARRYPPVLGIVGLSNSGKTTLAAHLIGRLSRDLRVAAVKHGHRFDFDRKGKDTYRFAEAGAVAVAFASPGQRGLATRTSRPPELDEVLASLPDPLDIVFVEGYKQTPIPKIEVVGADGRSLTREGQLHDVRAIATRAAPFDLGIPCFSTDDLDGIEAWVRAYMAERQ